jgi:hypothetical protein
MYGSVPGCYRNKAAAALAASAFSLEEKVEWTVCMKDCSHHGKELFWFKPVRKTDVGFASKDSYFEC